MPLLSHRADLRLLPRRARRERERREPGESAPAGQLFEFFGFTPENVASVAKGA